MRVKQSEIRTNGPWKMRTGHVNGMQWILGRHVVAHVKAQKTRNVKYAKMRKRARYASAQNANCGIVKCMQYVRCTKHKICKNAKITKVTALQQVQYKVLQYGLYVPIET